MREKLIELLCKAHGMATDASLFEDASYAQQLETEADHLIANGVTIPVRCKECKYSGMYAFGDGSGGETLACLTIEEDAFVRFATSVDPDHFCSYGERRTDD